MPTEPEVPQQLQWLYWGVVAPIATALTTLTYLIGKRKGGGESPAVDKERERLKEEVAALLRKDERNQINREIATACHDTEQRFNLAMAALRGDLEASAERVVKAVRESVEGQLKTLRDDTDRKLASLRRRRS